MLKSSILAGNSRLDRAAMGPPAIRRRLPDDDADAVSRIQRALKEIGYLMPVSFSTGEADGEFGAETFNAVLDFQRHAFPDDPSQWDGRVGRNTLAEMDDALLGSGEVVDGPALDEIISQSNITVPPNGLA